LKRVARQPPPQPSADVQQSENDSMTQTGDVSNSQWSGTEQGQGTYNATPLGSSMSVLVPTQYIPVYPGGAPSYAPGIPGIPYGAPGTPSSVNAGWGYQYMPGYTYRHMPVTTVSYERQPLYSPPVSSLRSSRGISPPTSSVREPGDSSLMDSGQVPQQNEESSRAQAPHIEGVTFQTGSLSVPIVQSSNTPHTPASTVIESTQEQMDSPSTDSSSPNPVQLLSDPSVPPSDLRMDDLLNYAGNTSLLSDVASKDEHATVASILRLSGLIDVVTQQARTQQQQQQQQHVAYVGQSGGSPATGQ
jgi:hypothetical protein